jgi:hypothetical protein
VLACPECGYKERVDWTKILFMVSFGLLYALWIESDFIPKHELRFYGLGALLIYTVGVMLTAYRGLKHLKLHARKLREALSTQGK